MKTHQHSKIRGVIAAMVVTLVFISQPFVACDAETAGETIRFRTAVMGATNVGQAPTSFTTVKGWNVILSSADAVFGPIYFYGGEPMAKAAPNPLLRIFGGVAMACPTHAQYDYGAVLGEVLEQYVVNLLAAVPTSTGEVQGEAGTCHSAELHLHPPGDQQLPAGSAPAQFAKLGGHSIAISGTATKDGTTLPFRAALDIPDEGAMRIVQNIAANVTLDNSTVGSGRIVVQIFLDAWFGQVDFSTLTETDADGNYLFSEGTQAQTALLQAMRNRYSYQVIWRAQ
ncbi:MAG: hypothetical protein JXR76_00710 [Deltaproteobacteria bacterium]|nr:hypothetical protein [Deltaproteobacteria bacterium]